MATSFSDLFPPVAPATDEDVDMMGEIEGADEVMLDGCKFRPEEPAQGPPLSSDGIPESPVHRLRERRLVWLAAMRRTGLMCAMTLSILSSGYLLEWGDGGEAPSVFQANHPSAMEDPEFKGESIRTGLAQGTMRKVTRDFLRCIQPLGEAVHARTGKKRLIYDARHVNARLVKTKFKMESLQHEGRALFHGCNFGGTCDLSQAYYHIDMHESAQPFLGFEWAGEYFCYTVLPFGLSTAPRIFTMVLKTPVTLLRSMGCKLMAYLDDLPFGHQTAAESLGHGRLIVSTLREFGWVIQAAKCVGLTSPLRRFEVLGTLVDLESKTFRVPDSKLTRILDSVSALLQQETAVAKTVARVKGLLASTWLSTGEHSRIRTRALDQVLQTRLRQGDSPQSKTAWRRKVIITQQAQADLQWWLAHAAAVNGRPIVEDALAGVFDGTIASDASEDGWGGWVACEWCEAGPSLSVLIRNALDHSSAPVAVKEAQRAVMAGWEVHCELLEDWKGGWASSTLREIYAAFMILTILTPLVAGGRFRLHLDNSASVMALGGRVPASATGGQAPKSVLGGSKVPEVQEFVIRIMDLALLHKIRIVAIWIPRAKNERADLLSRTSRLDQFEYNIKRSCFRSLDEDPTWAPARHSTDMFSKQENARVRSSRFCSRFFHPQAVWTDALSFRWRTAPGEMLWVHPPPRMIGAALTRMTDCGCSGTLISPRWVGASWWPLLYPRGSDNPPAPFVREVRMLGRVRDVMEGPGVAGGPTTHFGESLVMAFRIVSPRGE